MNMLVEKLKSDVKDGGRMVNLQKAFGIEREGVMRMGMEEGLWLKSLRSVNNREMRFSRG